MGKPFARACVSCRSRKIKCDLETPRCGACVAQGKNCLYRFEDPKPRPSRAIIENLQREKRALEDKLREISLASTEEREYIVRTLPLGSPSTPTRSSHASPPSTPPRRISELRARGHNSSDDDANTEITNFVSVDESGTVGVYGLTSGLHAPTHSKSPTSSAPPGSVSHQLIANALLQRQQEFYMANWDFDGVPPDLAIHLLDLHWNRQHHSFLLTYRPAIMRALAGGGGPYCSKLLLNAIFACVAKYSTRKEVRTDPDDPSTAGARFLARVKELLPHEMETSSISLLVALLLLGSTLVSSGKMSMGWLYSGMALRVVYDLGLHLDSRKAAEFHQWTLEDMEIRRRVFWGAFICDKLQSLYLGRPAAIQLRDAHVPLEFLDTSEEEELWSPYRDPVEDQERQDVGSPKPTQFAAPVHSVTTFKQLCLLSKLMTRVINKFYTIGATKHVSSKHTRHLLSIDEDLGKWESQLPPHLRFETIVSSPYGAAPNIITLQAHYFSLLILLHRPFIADGHLRSSAGPTLAATSWGKCTAAAQRLTHLISVYRANLTLRRAPYQIAYAVYVAGTIHVRNAGQGNQESRDMLNFCLLCLRELSTPNTGTAIAERVIRRLMKSMGVPQEDFPNTVALPSQEFSAWSNFDLDAIVRSFPVESPMSGNVAPVGGGQVGMSNLPMGFNPMGQTWNEESDTLFGLMGEWGEMTFNHGFMTSPSESQ